MVPGKEKEHELKHGHIATTVFFMAFVGLLEWRSSCNIQNQYCQLLIMRHGGHDHLSSSASVQSFHNSTATETIQTPLLSDSDGLGAWISKPRLRARFILGHLYYLLLTDLGY